MTAKTLLDELNYWYAIECAITLGNTDTVGLCNFVTSFLSRGGRSAAWRREEVILAQRVLNRLWAHRPNQLVYWWPLGDWTSRLDFVRQMIRLVERELGRQIMEMHILPHGVSND
jgi:hypothetical protein